MLFRFLLEPLGMFVRNLDSKLINQLRGGFKGRRCVCELRKDNKPHGKKRRRARDRGVDHREHAIRVRTHRASIEWISEIRLTSRD